jgi:hypothetical protein
MLNIGKYGSLGIDGRIYLRSGHLGRTFVRSGVDISSRVYEPNIKYSWFVSYNSHINYALKQYMTIAIYHPLCFIFK